MHFFIEKWYLINPGFRYNKWGRIIILEEVGHKLNITSTDVPLKIRFKAATKIKCI